MWPERPSAEQRAFDALKMILYRWAPAFNVVANESDHYLLNTFHVMKNKKPLFFGSVQIKKTYVSFHLMPLYVNPQLLEGLSPELRRRMQGKQCFNFKKPIAYLFDELKVVTKAGYEDYVKRGYI